MIKNLRVENMERELLYMLPEIYQERGSILHRYLSIFQTVYTDFRRQYEKLWEQMDSRNCSLQMLSLMEQWMGMSGIDALLPENVRREFLMRTAHLLKIRGTRQAVVEVANLLAGECPQVIESAGNTVVVLFRREISEELELQLLYLFKWFLPEKCRAHIVSWQEPMGMDEYCALDINAVLKVWSTGVLDKKEALNQCVLG